MTNRPVWQLFLSLCLVFVVLDIQAQNGTKSPYSIYGIGDLAYNGFIQNSMMGRTDRAFKQDNSFTYTNPASLAYLKKTSLQMGARMDIGKFTTKDSTLRETTFNNASFSYFSMGIPLSEKRGIALSFGLMPYSSKGYNITSFGTFDSAYYINDFGGSGGINKVFIGGGYLINNNLSVGANFNYLFGSLNETKFRVYPNQVNKFNYSNEISTYVKGAMLDFGLQYTGKLKHGIEHTLGLTAHLGNDLKASRIQLVRSFIFNGLGDAHYFDTVVDDRNKKGSYVIPFSFGVGYTIGTPEKLMFSLEYFSQDWSKFREYSVNPGLAKLSRYAAGLYYQPDQKFEKSSGRKEFVKNYFRFTRYSTGAYYEKTNLLLEGNQLSEFGITFGMQLPYVRQIKLPGGEQMTLVSRINLGVDYAKRGTTDNSLIQEDFLRIYLGFNFSDKWFIIRKYQ